MSTKIWPQYTYRVRIDELGPTSGGEGPRAEGGRGEESFKRSNRPELRVGGFFIDVDSIFGAILVILRWSESLFRFYGLSKS